MDNGDVNYPGVIERAKIESVVVENKRRHTECHLRELRGMET